MVRTPATRRPPSPAPARRPSPEAMRKAFRFRFFGETISELKKVTWPSRQETTRLTILVILISVFIGTLLSIVDMGFSRLLSLFI